MALLSGITAAASILAEITVQPYTTFPWALILNGAMDGIGFYALRIILLTVCLKLILSPLDFFQRYKMRKNQLITMRLKPQMENLEKAYGNNPKVLQQKQAELNKREGMSYLASCLPMIVTLIVFMWLWSAMRTNAEYKQFDNYVQIYERYDSAYVQAFGSDGDGYSWYDSATDRLRSDYGDEFETAFGAAYEEAYAADPSTARAEAYDTAIADAAVTASAEFATDYFTLFATMYADSYDTYVSSGAGTDYATLAGNASVVARLTASDRVSSDYCVGKAQREAADFFNGTGAYDGEGYAYDSFLWIRDIWSPDTPWSSSIAEDGNDFVSRVGTYATDASRSGISEEELVKMVSSYDTVMKLILEGDNVGVNGFLVLPVLAVALNIVSQIIMRRQQKKSGQDAQLGQNKGCMTAMVFVMPLLMAYFAFIYCAAFTLYMVVNSAMSLLINLVTTGITRKMIPADSAAGRAGERIETQGRPDPNVGKRGKK